MAYLRLFPTILIWWYSDGVKSLFDFMVVFFVHWGQVFAPVDLFLNLFSPWKKLIGSRGRGLDTLGDWLVDNFVSRTVGFVMRMTLLIIYFIFLVFYLIFFIFAVLGWFLMPGILVLLFIYIFKS